MSNEVIDEYFLRRRVWRLYQQAGWIATNELRFLAGGEVGNYKHYNESKWCIKDGTLCFLNGEGQVSTRFDNLEQDGDYVVISGQSLVGTKPVMCLTDNLAKQIQRPGTKLHFLDRILALGWDIGDHTYGDPSFIEDKKAKLHIGKYCSIAGGVRVFFANHRTDMVSTYPFSEFHRYWPSAPRDVADHVSRGDVRIGNDVWIGQDAFLMSGVIIGDGAVIGANCVVAKDVPPYAVVVGNPGRIVRYRFEDHVIRQLLEIRWWEWPDDVVDSFLPLMMSPDIVTFIEAAQLRFPKPSTM